MSRPIICLGPHVLQRIRLDWPEQGKGQGEKEKVNVQNVTTQSYFSLNKDENIFAEKSKNWKIF